MRALIGMVAAVAMVVAQVPAFAQSVSPTPQAATQNSAIATAFKAFPSGGEPLRMRIAELITANPKLAAELVVYMRNAQGLNRAQKVAAEHGLAAAADQLGIKARQACPRMVVKGERADCCPDGTWRYERNADGTLYDVGCEDPWFIAASILAVAAMVCIAACRERGDIIIVQPPSNN